MGRSRSKGLLVFRNHLAAMALGVITVTAAFAAAPVPDSTGGCDPEGIPLQNTLLETEAKAKKLLNASSSRDTSKVANPRELVTECATQGSSELLAAWKIHQLDSELNLLIAKIQPEDSLEKIDQKARSLYEKIASELKSYRSRFKPEVQHFFETEGQRLLGEFRFSLAIAAGENAQARDHWLTASNLQFAASRKSLAKIPAKERLAKFPGLLSRTLESEMTLELFQQRRTEASGSPLTPEQAAKSFQQLTEKYRKLSPATLESAEIHSIELDALLTQSSVFPGQQRPELGSATLRVSKLFDEQQKMLSQLAANNRSPSQQQKIRELQAALSLTKISLKRKHSVDDGVSEFLQTLKQTPDTEAQKKLLLAAHTSLLGSVAGKKLLQAASREKLPVAELESNEKRIGEQWNETLKNHFPDELLKKMDLPSYSEMLAHEGGELGDEMQNLLTSFEHGRQAFVELDRVKQNKTSSAAEQADAEGELDRKLTNVDLTWVQLRCMKEFSRAKLGSPSPSGSLKSVETPFRSLSVNFSACSNPSLALAELRTLAWNVTDTAISKKQSRETNWLVAETAFDVAMVPLSAGAGTLVKKGIQKGARKLTEAVIRQTIRKTVAGSMSRTITRKSVQIGGRIVEGTIVGLTQAEAMSVGNFFIEGAKDGDWNAKKLLPTNMNSNSLMMGAAGVVTGMASQTGMKLLKSRVGRAWRSVSATRSSQVLMTGLAASGTWVAAKLSGPIFDSMREKVSTILATKGKAALEGEVQARLESTIKGDFQKVDEPVNVPSFILEMLPLNGSLKKAAGAAFGLSKPTGLELMTAVSKMTDAQKKVLIDQANAELQNSNESLESFLKLQDAKRSLQKIQIAPADLAKFNGCLLQ